MIREFRIEGRRVKYVLDGYAMFSTVVRSMCAGYNYEVTVWHGRGKTRYFFPYADRPWIEVEHSVDRLLAAFDAARKSMPAAFGEEA